MMIAAVMAPIPARRWHYRGTGLESQQRRAEPNLGEASSSQSSIEPASTSQRVVKL